MFGFGKKKKKDLERGIKVLITSRHRTDVFKGTIVQRGSEEYDCWIIEDETGQLYAIPECRIVICEDIPEDSHD
jgi:hypothetical protein